jgi:hypothetical protein
MSVVQLLTFNDAESQEKYASEVEELSLKVQEREKELIDIQKKIIELYEELRKGK